MNWTDVPAGIINAAQQRLLVALGEHADLVADRINADPAFVNALARFAKNGGSESSGLITPCPFFANEERPSTYEYPQSYAIRPVCEQLVEFGKHFPNLNSGPVLACSKQLPEHPLLAEGPFVVPKWQKVASSHNEAVEKVLGLIGNKRAFHNYRKGALGPKYLRQSERTMVAESMLDNQQPGDYLLLWAQFGLLHRGKSVRRVRVIYAPNEFGLGAFAIGCMLLTHPERLVQLEQLHIDCPGDEYAPDAGGVFSDAPFFLFSVGGVKFDADSVALPVESYGSASAFLPQP